MLYMVTWGWRGEVTHTSNYKIRTRPRSLYPIFVFFLTYDTMVSFIRVFCRLTNGSSHLNQRLANYGPRAKSSPHSIVVNKVLLEHSHPRLAFKCESSHIQSWVIMTESVLPTNLKIYMYIHIYAYVHIWTHTHTCIYSIIYK